MPDLTPSIPTIRAGDQIANGSFQSSIDWDTGINLPVLFRGSWKLTPSLGVANRTSRSVRDPEPEHQRQLRASRGSGSASAYGLRADVVRSVPGLRAPREDPAQPLPRSLLELSRRRPRCPLEYARAVATCRGAL